MFFIKLKRIKSEETDEDFDRLDKASTIPSLWNLREEFICEKCGKFSSPLNTSSLVTALECVFWNTSPNMSALPWWKNQFYIIIEQSRDFVVPNSSQADELIKCWFITGFSYLPFFVSIVSVNGFINFFGHKLGGCPVFTCSGGTHFFQQWKRRQFSLLRWAG